jgi:hypothetical protein
MFVVGGVVHWNVLYALCSGLGGGGGDGDVLL